MEPLLTALFVELYTFHSTHIQQGPGTSGLHVTCWPNWSSWGGESFCLLLPWQQSCIHDMIAGELMLKLEGIVVWATCAFCTNSVVLDHCQEVYISDALSIVEEVYAHISPNNSLVKKQGTGVSCVCMWINWYSPARGSIKMLVSIQTVRWLQTLAVCVCVWAKWHDAEWFG